MQANYVKSITIYICVRLQQFCLCILLSCAIQSSAWAGGVEAESGILRGHPERLSISSPRDTLSVIATYELPDGSSRDVTADIKVECDDTIAKFENETFVPVANGKATAKLSYQGQSLELPIEVSKFDSQDKLGFRKHILPIFTKSGCNAGKCHGAASGKDGFRLSLYGFDPAGDHFRLTREMVGRRINLADPENCLLVNKALGMVPHTGGGLLDQGDENYAKMIEWMRDGAPVDAEDAVVPTSIVVYPRNVVFAKPNELHKLLVMANYSDGTTRDVTAQAVYFSNNEGTASVSNQGMVQSTGNGSAFILARFDQFTEGTSLIVRPGTAFEFPELSANNYIDKLVYSRLKNLNIIPSEVASDEQFIRRAYLDFSGKLPDLKALDTFLTDARPDKRDRLIDELIEQPDFQKLWVMHWAELLQIRTNNGMSPKALSLYDQWLREKVYAGYTIDKIVRELLPASGGTFTNPATNYFQTETSPQLIAESVAQVFLGTRIQCAQCHNHPFDRWTMDDYYGFANFFSQVGYKPASDPRELTIYNLGEGEIKHPIAGRKVVTKFLGGNVPKLSDGADYREPLAVWLTSQQNPAFARNIANVVWSHFFGMGIIDPIDDFRVSNPPSNPELLDALAEHLVQYDFNVGKLAADICKSRTYQLSVATNATNQLDQCHFSHGKVRRLRAEVLLDCIVQVTAAPERLSGLPANGRAIELADGPTANYFLTTFGRSSRATPCSCEVKTSPTLSQALHLLNGDSTNGKIQQGELVKQLMERLGNPQTVADELYRMCYSRSPSAAEQKAIQQQLTDYATPQAGLEDLFWALLNSNEFVFNH